MKLKKREWVCTDPDSLQFRRLLCDEPGRICFELVQLNCYGDGCYAVAHGRVYIDQDVDAQEVENLTAVYDWPDEVLNSPEFPGILAEAVFETSAPEYDLSKHYPSEHEAAIALGTLIGVDVTAYWRTN